jgi:transposase InsO family protein
MDQRRAFALRALSEKESFTDLCEEFDISRKTGYKWKDRMVRDGIDGMHELSRRPQSMPRGLPEPVVCEIVKLKMAHRAWGPRKIRALYAKNHPREDVPSDSTFKRVIERAGLVEKRRIRKSRDTGRIQNRRTAKAPNELWTIDFKGWWYTADRQRCEPLTVRDSFSRYIFCAAPLENARTETVREQLEQLFKRYGLPAAIRSDNGPPFAGQGSPPGLSRLSAWWLALGISLDRIDPGRPDQNGAHERMHRDIAWEVEPHARGTAMENRNALEVWRHAYNQERPHEALGMQTPSSVYKRSEKLYAGTPDEIQYPLGFMTRKVTGKGFIKLRSALLPISTALIGWHIGLKPESKTELGVWFADLRIGTIDIETRSFRPA